MAPQISRKYCLVHGKSGKIPFSSHAGIDAIGSPHEPLSFVLSTTEVAIDKISVIKNVKFYIFFLF
jgi:hypothetical protein